MNESLNDICNGGMHVRVKESTWTQVQQFNIVGVHTCTTFQAAIRMGTNKLQHGINVDKTSNDTTIRSVGKKRLLPWTPLLPYFITYRECIPTHGSANDRQIAENGQLCSGTMRQDGHQTGFGHIVCQQQVSSLTFLQQCDHNNVNKPQHHRQAQTLRASYGVGKNWICRGFYFGNSMHLRVKTWWHDISRCILINSSRKSSASKMKLYVFCRSGKMTPSLLYDSSHYHHVRDLTNFVTRESSSSTRPLGYYRMDPNEFALLVPDEPITYCGSLMPC